MLRRLTASVALIVLIPTSAILLTYLLKDISGGFGLQRLEDPTNQMNAWFAVLSIAAALGIWRRFVAWTRRRLIRTAVIGLVPLAQVVYAQPLWDAGCFTSDALKIGQEQVCLGAWIFLAVWIWWSKALLPRFHPIQAAASGAAPIRKPAVELFNVYDDSAKTANFPVTPPASGSPADKRDRAPASAATPVAAGRTADASAGAPGPARMTPTARRILASIGAIPITVGIFLIVVIALSSLSNIGHPVSLALAYALCAVFFTLLWMLIWRGLVVFRRDVIWGTTGWAALLMLLPCVVIVLLPNLGSPASNARDLAPLLGWGAFMIVTVSRWPIHDTSDVPSSGPLCPSCGYALTGLTRTRCPECGCEPTLEQLWQAQDRTRV
ncbi:MAG: hypothetical protein FLDDKLPJ_00464 [Phycisphaerae bacterium]|nr:hypothetical protein [Phycisphaerae bacterium]